MKSFPKSSNIGTIYMLPSGLIKLGWTEYIAMASLDKLRNLLSPSKNMRILRSARKPLYLRWNHAFCLACRTRMRLVEGRWVNMERIWLSAILNVWNFWIIQLNNYKNILPHQPFCATYNLYVMHKSFASIPLIMCDT